MENKRISGFFGFQARFKKKELSEYYKSIVFVSFFATDIVLLGSSL